MTSRIVLPALMVLGIGVTAWLGFREGKSTTTSVRSHADAGMYLDVEAARIAFTDALGIAVLVSAVAALAGSIFIAKLMPAHHLPVDGGNAPVGIEASDLPDAGVERTG